MREKYKNKIRKAATSDKRKQELKRNIECRTIRKIKRKIRKIKEQSKD